MTKIKHGLHRDLSNEDYHAVLAGDAAAYSSSQLKDALEDIEIFYKKYITKELKSKSIPAFDIGTYFHTAILEPHLLEKECAVWSGARRAGKAYEAFVEENKGKAIITSTELDKATNLINATKGSPIAMDILSKGEAEVSLFWKICGVECKVRADWLYLAPIDSDEDSYIADLKSTTGNCTNAHVIKGKIGSYKYDLSTSFYIDMFNQYLIDEGLDKKFKLIKKFYWIFASKDMANCKTYEASQRTIEIGRVKYKKALHTIKTYKALDWEFVDYIEELDLPVYEDEWLKIDPESLDIPKQNVKFDNVDKVTSNKDEDIL